ncbi:MAG TPA: DUF4178 domain-containing protein, partial [Actinomycetes bacterium]|nr:DUF4178 domain-containing protein [Actinomycetes bacterium]
AVVFYRRYTAMQAAQRHSARAAGPPRDPLATESVRSDPRRITVGDVIRFDGRDFIVRGTIRFDQDGFQWQEHFLDDVEVKRWLSVEEDEGLEIGFWTAIKGADLQPGPKTIEYGGKTYELEEKGSARFTAVGTTGTGAAGRVEYFDYQAGDDLLAFERYGEGDWEVATGRTVGEYELDIYPGSD